MKLINKRSLFYLLLGAASALLIYCTAGATIGTATGTLNSDGQVRAFEINFTALTISFDQQNNNLMSLTLTNASNDSLTFILSPKNSSGSSLETLYPTGVQYSFSDNSLNSVSGLMTIVGTDKSSVAADSGYIILNQLTTVGNSISSISATFDVSSSDGLRMYGDFSETFSSGQ